MCDRGCVDAMVSLFEDRGPLVGVVCGTPIAYHGHRDGGTPSRCVGDGCLACGTSGPPDLIFLFNLFESKSHEMRVVEGPGTLIEEVDAIRATCELARTVVRFDPSAPVSVEVTGPVAPGLAAAIRSSGLHVLARFVPGSDVYAKRVPAPVDLDANALKRGLIFVHGMGMRSRYELMDTTSRVLALTEELVARGHINLRRLDSRRERLRQEQATRFQEQPHVVTDPTEDKYALEENHSLPCAELIPICKGRCCRLHFPLSLQDVAEGVVEWEIDRPYQCKKGPRDDYCVHSCEETRGCGVYEHRPPVCRTYDCRSDTRIWLDYEARIPAPWDAVGGPGAKVEPPAPSVGAHGDTET